MTTQIQKTQIPTIQILTMIFKRLFPKSNINLEKIENTSVDLIKIYF